MSPPFLHELPEDALRYIASLIPSSTPTRTCLSQTTTLKALAALGSTHPSLRSLATTGALLPSLHPCLSCATAAPAAHPLALAALLRFAGVSDFAAPPCGWGRAGVREMLDSVAVAAGGRLRALDLAGVEMDERLHRVAFQSLCEAVKRGGDKKVEELKVWAGAAWVWDVLGESRVLRNLRVFAVRGVEDIKKCQHVLERARVVLVAATHGEDGGQLIELEVSGCGVGYWVEALEHGMDEAADGDYVNSTLADAFVDARVLRRIRVLRLNVPVSWKELAGLDSGALSALRELRLCDAGKFGGGGSFEFEDVQGILDVAPLLERIGLRGVRVKPGSFAKVIALLGNRLVEFVGCYTFNAPSELKLLVSCCGGSIERLTIACNEEEREGLGFGVEGPDDVFGLPSEEKEGGLAAGSCDHYVLQMAHDLKDVGKLEELELDDGGLTFATVEAVLICLSTLRTLRLVHSTLPRKVPSFQFALQYKDNLRVLVVDTRRFLHGHHVRWGLTPEHVIAVVDAAVANKCAFLVEFRSSLQFTTLCDDAASKESLWKALDRLEVIAPNVCLARLRAAIYHPFKAMRRIRRSHD